MTEQPMVLRYISTTDLINNKAEFVMTKTEEENLTESLSQNGFVVPIYVRPILQHNFEVLDGKKRVLVAQKLEIQRVPCIVYDYMNDTVAKEYILKLKEINNNINADREKEAESLLCALKSIIESFEINIGASIEKIATTRREQELFQTVCTAYSIEAAECMCELRKINYTKEVDPVMNSLRKTQEYMLNIQHRVGAANVKLMEMEEQILKSYNLIIDSLELGNNIRKFYRDKQIL